MREFAEFDDAMSAASQALKAQVVRDARELAVCDPNNPEFARIAARIARNRRAMIALRVVSIA